MAAGGTMPTAHGSIGTFRMLRCGRERAQRLSMMNFTELASAPSDSPPGCYR